MKKRWMSLLLALAMIVTMIPAVEVEAAPGTSVELGEPDFTDDTEDYVKFNNVKVSSVDKIKTVVVSVDKGAIDITGVNKAYTVMSDKETNGFHQTYAWINTEGGWSVDEVKTLIESIIFTYEPGMYVNVTVDANNVSGNFNSDITITGGNIHQAFGHYYMYVPYDPNESALTMEECAKLPEGWAADPDSGYHEPTWVQAYNKSKQFVLMGMQGYLATITSGEVDANGNIGEAGLLHKINDKAAWCAGTVLVQNQQSGDPATLKLADPNEIVENSNTLKVYADGDNTTFGNMEPVEYDKTNDAYTADHNRQSFYWACGPEAGQVIQTNLWSDGELDKKNDEEPNHNTNTRNNPLSKATFTQINGSYSDNAPRETCVIANFQSKPGLNDIMEGNYDEIRSTSAARAFGYFVEFGGYPDDEQNYGDKRSTQVKMVRILNLKGTVNHGTIEGEQSISKTISANTAYTAEVKADGGYRVPATEEAAKYIEVKVGGKTLDSSQYTWTPSTTKDSEGYVTSGTITIKDTAVTGNVEIVVDCIQKPPYTLTKDVQDGEYTGKTGENAVKLGEEYTAKITAAPNYELPDDITVTIAGRELDSSEYTYNSADGTVTIPGDKIIGDVDIKAVCTPVKYTVKGTVTGGTFPGGGTTINGTIEAGKEYSTTVTPNTKAGYELPGADGVEVKVNGQKLTKSQYTYDPESGKITIPGSSVTGNVEITVVCPKDDGKYKVTDDVKNGEFEGEDTVEPGEDYEATITPDEGYKLPDEIKVTVDGKELSEDDYEWDPETGEVYIPESSITGDIKIVAVCTKEPYEAEGDVTNGEFDGEPEAEPGKDYEATVTPDEGYKLPDKIKVTVDGKEIPESDYTWDPKTGKVKIKGKAVTGDIVVIVKCEKKSSSGSGSGNGSGSGSSGSGKVSATPKTGDDMNVMLYVVLMLLAMGGFAGCAVYRIKLKRNE